MKKKFEALTFKLNTINTFNAQLGSIANSSSGVPALYQLGSAFFGLISLSITELLTPVMEELDDYHHQSGPLAKHAILNCKLTPSEQGMDLLKSTLIQAYPPVFNEKDQLQSNFLLKDIIPGEISSDSTSSDSVLDLYNHNPKIKEAMAAEWWKEFEPIILKAESEINPKYFPDNWKGSCLAKLSFLYFQNADVKLCVNIFYSNGCSVKITLGLSLITDLYSGPQLRVSRYGLLTWDIPNPTLLGFDQSSQEFRKELEQLMGECENTYEEVTYPVKVDHFNHLIVKALFRSLIEKMGVDFDQSQFDQWSDPKFLYVKVRELMHEPPLPKLDVFNLFENQLKQLTTFTSLMQDDYNRRMYNECYNEYRLVEKSDSPDFVLPKELTDIVTYATVIDYFARYVEGSSLGLNAVIVLNDRTEEAQLYVCGRNRKFKPEQKLTPRTIYHFVESLRKSRENILNKRKY